MMLYLLAGFVGVTILIVSWFLFSPADMQYKTIHTVRRLRWFASKEDKTSDGKRKRLLSESKG